MKSAHIKEIEKRVKDYFGGMELPDTEGRVLPLLADAYPFGCLN